MGSVNGKSRRDEVEGELSEAGRNDECVGQGREEMLEEPVGRIRLRRTQVASPAREDVTIAERAAEVRYCKDLRRKAYARGSVNGESL